MKSKFLIKFARNQEDVKTAQRLRFEVFNLEMKKGLTSSYDSGLDQDEFDSLCDHILVIDKNENKTVGTYRLLLRSSLKNKECFYSEREFDLSNIKKLKGEILELGRSCVHKDYRSNVIVVLLWDEIIKYLKEHNVQYVIGCPSIYIKRDEEVSKIYALIKKDYYASEDFRVWPKDSKVLNGLKRGIRIDGQEKELFLKLPSLVRSYFKAGALICGEPAVDKEFGSVDFFMLLESKNLSDVYLKRLGVRKGQGL